MGFSLEFGDFGIADIGDFATYKFYKRVFSTRCTVYETVRGPFSYSTTSVAWAVMVCELLMMRDVKEF